MAAWGRPCRIAVTAGATHRNTILSSRRSSEAGEGQNGLKRSKSKQLGDQHPYNGGKEDFVRYSDLRIKE